MSRNTKIIIGVVVIVAGIAICRFLVGALMLGSSIFYAQSFESSAQYFLTVSEVTNENGKMIDKQIRISGAVVGESIEYDEASGNLSFLIADSDPNRQRIQVVYVGEKPELLRNMAQAIMIGELRSDGIFYADEILLKCPSRYEEAVPDQAIN